jgi:hypothetical protein
VAKKPLTDDQKIEIYKRHANGQSPFDIKKEMGIDNGQQIAGVLSTQYTKTGQYLLKKAGLPGPSVPPRAARRDLVSPDVSEESAIRSQLQPVPKVASEQPQAVLPLVEQPLATGAAPAYQLGPTPIQRSPGMTMPSSSNVIGFRPDGATIKFIVYRETPFRAHIGTFSPPWDVSEIGPRYGDGEYTVEKWSPGRQAPDGVMRLPVSGFGPARVPQYEGQGMNAVPQTPVEPPSVMADKLLTAVQTGINIAVANKPTAAAPTHLDQLAHDALKTQLEKATNPVQQGDDFWKNWMRTREEERKEERERREIERRDSEERYKRESVDREMVYKREKEERENQYKREKEERESDHNRRMEEQDKKHGQDLEKIKTEAEERRKASEESEARRRVQDEAHEKAIAEINSKKLDWAMKESSKAVEESNNAITAAEEKLAKKIDELNATATKERERDRADAEKDRGHLLKEIEFQRSQLAIEKDFQEQLLEIKKLQANANNDKLMQLGEKLLEAVNDRTKDILEVKKAEAVLANNPGFATAAMNNQGVINQLAKANANNTKGGERDMTNKLDNIANTQEFHDFIEEWCLHLESEVEAEVLFDTMQRKYQQNDPGISEVMDFMAGRQWPKAKAMIWKYLSNEEQAIFQSEGAEPYYKKMRAMIILMKASAMKQWTKWEAERPLQGSTPAPVQPPASEPVEESREEVVEAEVVSDPGQQS